MNKKTILLLLVLIGISCTRPKPETYIEHLSGYWEINKVLTTQGAQKNYNYNQTIDYITVQNRKGIRTKVQPQLNGHFIATNHTEKFTLKIENDSLRLYYETPFSSWKETVVTLKEKEMIVQNEDGNLYFYRPYQKINSTHGKKTE